MSTSLIPPPTGIALVVCDNVYTDSGGKRALIGLFNQIIATSFPAFHHRLCAFVSLTSLRPQTVCKLEIVDAETDEPIVSMQGPLRDDNPTTILDLVFELHGVTFPHPGVYFVRFGGQDRVLMERPLEVVATNLDPQGEPNEDTQQ